MIILEHNLIRAVRDKNQEESIKLAGLLAKNIKDTPKCIRRSKVFLSELNGIFYWNSVKYFSDSKTIANYLSVRRKYAKKLNRTTNSGDLIHILNEMVTFYSVTEDHLINASTSPLIKNLIIYIHNNCDQNILLDDLSKNFNISRSYLSYLIRSETRKSLPDIILYFRLKKAKQYLEKTNYSVNEISNLCGFKSPSYFCKLFKNKYSLSPKQYHIQYQNQNSK